MGRRDNERRRRIQDGLEAPRVRAVAGRVAVHALSKGSTPDQIERLESLVGTGDLPISKLKAAIEQKAPEEMDKAIMKLQKAGRDVTVDSLCYEMRLDQQFLKMCARVGIPLEWFEELAKRRMEANGL